MSKRVDNIRGNILMSLSYKFQVFVYRYKLKYLPILNYLYLYRVPIYIKNAFK